MQLLFLYLHELPEAFTCNPYAERDDWKTFWSNAKNDQDVLTIINDIPTGKCRNTRQIIISDNIDATNLIKELIIMSFELHKMSMVSIEYLQSIIEHDFIETSNETYNILVAMAYFFKK